MYNHLKYKKFFGNAKKKAGRKHFFGLGRQTTVTNDGAKSRFSAVFESESLDVKKRSEFLTTERITERCAEDPAGLHARVSLT